MVHGYNFIKDTQYAVRGGQKPQQGWVAIKRHYAHTSVGAQDRAQFPSISMEFCQGPPTPVMSCHCRRTTPTVRKKLYFYRP